MGNTSNLITATVLTFLCATFEYRDVSETTEVPKDAETEQGKPEQVVPEDASEKKVPEEDKVKFCFWCNFYLLD